MNEFVIAARGSEGKRKAFGSRCPWDGKLGFGTNFNVILVIVFFTHSLPSPHRNGPMVVREIALPQSGFGVDRDQRNRT